MYCIKRLHLATIGMLSACALAAPSAHAFKLISEDEAKLPPATPMLTRGITRGPTIRQIHPDPASGAIKSPVALKIAFEPRGGSKIDTSSIRMTYLRATPVDLSERVRGGISERGLDLANAEIPPGDHEILISLHDTEGRKTTQTIRLSIAK